MRLRQKLEGVGLVNAWTASAQPYGFSEVTLAGEISRELVGR